MLTRGQQVLAGLKKATVHTGPRQKTGRGHAAGRLKHTGVVVAARSVRVPRGAASGRPILKAARLLGPRLKDEAREPLPKVKPLTNWQARLMLNSILRRSKRAHEPVALAGGTLAVRAKQ